MTLFTCKCDDAAQPFLRFVARTENRKNIQILLPVEFAMDKSLKGRKNKYFIYFSFIQMRIVFCSEVS